MMCNFFFFFNFVVFLQEATLFPRWFYYLLLSVWLLIFLILKGCKQRNQSSALHCRARQGIHFKDDQGFLKNSLLVRLWFLTRFFLWKGDWQGEEAFGDQGRWNSWWVYQEASVQGVGSFQWMPWLSLWVSFWKSSRIWEGIRCCWICGMWRLGQRVKTEKPHSQRMKNPKKYNFLEKCKRLDIEEHASWTFGIVEVFLKNGSDETTDA